MQLAIDTASETASIALSDRGRLTAELTWRCRRNHTVELLPSIDKLLAHVGAGKDDLDAVFVCTGPGMYTGLRVGISVAKGLARARGLPLVGAGRLELDAYPHANCPGAVIAVHKAGRGEFAWAAYVGKPWRELSPPRLSKPEELAAEVRGETLFTGEIDEKLVQALEDVSAPVSFAPASASIRRAASLAELAHQRLEQGATDEPALLRPVYLRPPAIGPQQQSS
jgi:tRNA threonylcarbamoyladenosine biosynthesis protein TsaB